MSASSKRAVWRPGKEWTEDDEAPLKTLTTFETGGVSCSFLGDPQAYVLPSEEEIERAKNQRRQPKRDDAYSSLPAELAAWLRSRPKLDRDGKVIESKENGQ